MTIGGQVSEDDAAAVVHCYKSACEAQKVPVMLDSALMYPTYEKEGLTDAILGRLRKADPTLALPIATKANPWGDRTLSKANVREQLETSLEKLGVAKVDIFYLHAPDYRFPLVESLEACAAMHEEGKFDRLGLSNFPAWQVVEAVLTCEKNGWVKPTVYQGMYNAITRQVEPELFPCLRQFGLVFYAFNITAGGLLTGKHKPSADIPDGRFSAERYRERFWKDDYHQAVEHIRSACDAAGISMVHAALRWIMNHSLLRKDDAVIIGGSKLEHIKDNVAACFEGPLPAAVVEAIDQANEMARRSAPPYHRFHQKLKDI